MTLAAVAASRSNAAMAQAPTPAMLLRADVRLFGDILGRVLKAEEGEAVFRAREQQLTLEALARPDAGLAAGNGTLRREIQAGARNRPDTRSGSGRR